MYSKFESEVNIRPDDIDLNDHVHFTKYLDYVLAARYEQMEKDYKMPMEEFHKLGYNWVVSISHIEYKRALILQDKKVIVRTQINDINGAQLKLNFWIEKKSNNKVAAEGYFVYTFLSLNNGRPVRIPDDIIEHYAI